MCEANRAREAELNKTDQSPANGVAAMVEQLRHELTGGLLYTHHRANANTNKTLEAASFTYALIELLIEKGLITEEELNERKRKAAVRLANKFRDEGMGVIRPEPEYDKYTFEAAPPIDCESRIPLCRAACCRLQFALTRQDIEEGVVGWDFSHPYMIRRAAGGYCTHLDEGVLRCNIYAQRPVPCRAYNCRSDQRIWADFEKRLPSPELE